MQGGAVYLSDDQLANAGAVFEELFNTEAGTILMTAWHNIKLGVSMRAFQGPESEDPAKTKEYWRGQLDGFDYMLQQIEAMRMRARQRENEAKERAKRRKVKKPFDPFKSSASAATAVPS